MNKIEILVFKICSILAVIVMVLFVYGCTTDSGKNEIGSTDGEVHAFSVKLPNGQNVVCVTWKDGYSGGLSCDWTHVE